MKADSLKTNLLELQQTDFLAETACFLPKRAQKRGCAATLSEIAEPTPDQRRQAPCKCWM